MAAHPRAARSSCREAEIGRIEAYFAQPAFERRPAKVTLRAPDRAFDRWVTRNTHAHKQPGYAIVTISLKPIGGIPGDASADQMDAIADLAERYSFDEVRVTHEQNLVLPHVRLARPVGGLRALKTIGLAEANAGLVTDIIACPGLDYCALANARSIPIAQRISERLAARQDAIGDLKIKISGCINACGHHHVGHIGILGVEKRGEEHYQLLLGGSGAEDAALAAITGPGFGPDGIVDAVEKVVDTYLELRSSAQRAIPRRLRPPRLHPLQGGPLCRRLRRCLPLPACGERVGVRGSSLHLRRRMLLPLTLTLSPLKSGERGDCRATIWRDGAFRRDAWVKAEADGPPPDGPVILSKKRWLAERERWPSAARRWDFSSRLARRSTTSPPTCRALP